VGLVKTIQSSRRIPGDATSAALLLSGPRALDLWPGLHQVHTAPGRYAALSPVGDDPLAPVVVRADPPQRTATAYLTRFHVTGNRLPQASGQLRVRSSWHAGQPGTDVEVSIAGDGWGPALHQQMSTAVEGFLDNLAHATGGNSTSHPTPARSPRVYSPTTLQSAAGFASSI